ncbi:oxygen-independent coproporphyrinogen III oxidase [Falsiroseomonas bella]|uniref:Coproporphyrinogen-III oxidase n=1 Tax=Falsiroseomonas bella TaxID=2184016 RepID=A0A317F742_9PROT|nr:oxygen-independent coproporphyrinogen III oxidase [Falsiroseomonas bella]PWS34844.1 oxygen-independent coproporphyrinogen III oxidase [Falsiroseomonas bella]
MDALPDPRARLEAYARQNLPRYTSYPTAPHFGPLEEATYRAWLAEIRPGDTLSLYLHIPFCKELCWYCGCHTAITRNQARLSRYAAGLVKEIGLLAAALPAQLPVESLHFGGGTPSAIGAPGLAEVMEALRARFAFRPDAELSVELDPRTLEDDVVALLGRVGFNRASLGVQDMDPEVQKLAGRIQPREMVESAVTRLRGAGIHAINFDLMYGLPGQDSAHVAASARFAAEMGADRVAVFGYAHVPWMKPAQKAIQEALLPDTFARMEQAETAERTLLEAGYVAIGLDHFARPEDPMAVAQRAGVLRRNFQGYTTDRAPVLLGLGASAIGALPQGYAQNNPDERGWLAAVEGGRLPVARGLALTEDDRIRRSIIEQVMCDLTLDLATVPAPVWESAEPRLAPLLRDGLARLEAGRLSVTEAGRRFVRHVAACFDARLGASQARHSRAV